MKKIIQLLFCTLIFSVAGHCLEAAKKGRVKQKRGKETKSRKNFKSSQVSNSANWIPEDKLAQLIASYKSKEIGLSDIIKNEIRNKALVEAVVIQICKDNLFCTENDKQCFSCGEEIAGGLLSAAEHYNGKRLFSLLASYRPDHIGAFDVVFFNEVLCKAAYAQNEKAVLFFLVEESVTFDGIQNARNAFYRSRSKMGEENNTIKQVLDAACTKKGSRKYKV